ncbi:MAG: hypothetical protein IJ831_04670 [Spirochaetales bacterium]|nr:hypothetical protein [Spirochaetales bacterium]
MDEKLALRLMKLSSRIAIVSPLSYIALDGVRKLSSIDTVSVPTPAEDGYLSVYEFPKGEDFFYEDHLLFRKVMLEEGCTSRDVLSLYELVKASALMPLSIKGLMARGGIKDFYRVRSLFDRFTATGLIIPIPAEDGGRNLYIPYFYHGEDANVLIIRHLLSLGYRVTYEKRDALVLHARRFDGNLAVSYGANDSQLALLSIFRECQRILVTPKSHIIHFRMLLNLTLREFLGSNCPSLESDKMVMKAHFDSKTESFRQYVSK